MSEHVGYVLITALLVVLFAIGVAGKKYPAYVAHTETMACIENGGAPDRGFCKFSAE